MTLCEHGKKSYNCSVCCDCGHGKLKQYCSICNNCGHDKIKARCNICNDCGHGKIKAECSLCNACEHGMLKYNCVICYDCGHGTVKKYCSICNDCGHGKTPSCCKICYDCGHGKLKHSCKICSHCSHGKVKNVCNICNDCGHGTPKSLCKICSDCSHGKIKSECSICNDCGHGKISKKCVICSDCGHGKLKFNCVICNDCGHGKIKSRCNICSDCGHGKLKQFCKICDGSMLCKSPHCEIAALQSKYKGYCLRCFVHTFPYEKISRNFKIKERHVVDYILSSFPQYTFVIDKKVYDGCSKRRPDILLDLGEYVIIIEIDENQHKLNGYSSCDNKRIMEISQDLNHRPLVIIRFNPDAYYNNEGIRVDSCFTTTKSKGLCIINKVMQNEWDKRLQSLKNTLNNWCITKPSKTIEIVKLFYDEKDIEIDNETNNLDLEYENIDHKTENAIIEDHNKEIINSNLEPELKTIGSQSKDAEIVIKKKPKLKQNHVSNKLSKEEIKAIRLAEGIAFMKSIFTS